MQNHNIHPWSWGQGSAPAFSGTQPLLPTNFPPPGVDQNPLLSGYQQLYGNTSSQPPPDYGQWTATQLQQWHQWQQWQEKYQQWQAQYGKKYAESLAALGQTPNLIVPGVPPIMGVTKALEHASCISNPPLPANSQPVPPPPPDEEKPPLPSTSAMNINDISKSNLQSAQDNPEELSEAEKTFDIQFRQWEGQFNEWKKQNEDHPDKAQYREYEKKWETWREQLLQRREQMRRKRLSKTSEQLNEGNNSGKTDDTKSKPTTMPTPSPLKSSESEYNYRTQLTSSSQVSFPGETIKFDNKVSFFEKPPVCQSSTMLPNLFSSRGCGSQDKNSSQPAYLANNLAGYSMEKVDFIRQGSHPNNQSFNRSQASFKNQSGGVDSCNDKNFNQRANSRFGNIESEVSDNSINMKFRNSNFDESRFGGNFENFGPRPLFGSEERPLQRFSGDFRSERDFSQQRFFENNRDREGAAQVIAKGNFDLHERGGNESSDFRPSNCPPYARHMGNATSKTKVPSLFDITVEKPAGLTGPPNNDRKPKVWDKYEKDGYDAFDKKQEDRDQDRNEKSRTNTGAWPKNSSSPWMQPWEVEKMTSQKTPDTKTWERETKVDGKLWMKNISGQQEIDKAELSGYVGSILAKLGNINVVPSLLVKSENSQGDTGAAQYSGGKSPSQTDSNNKLSQNNQIGQKDCEKQSFANDLPSKQSDEPDRRNHGRSGSMPLNFEPTGARDFDERGHDFNERLRDGSFAPKNFDRLEESGKDSGEKTHFEMESKNFDIDERLIGRDDRISFRRDDRGAFARDDTRNFSRPPYREDRRNLSNDDRFFGRDDRSYNRLGRDDRGFGRFNVHDDIDDRFGNRTGRRGFDRFDRDDRDGRFFDRPGPAFDRFARGRDQQINEPVWNPQVFDYSQGRPKKLPDSDDGFKISTVVDYSHGENKQTFDYGHGEVTTDRLEMRSFDYGHKADAPTVIDYAHGVDRDSMENRSYRSLGSEQNVESKSKGNSGNVSPIRRRSRSPRGRLRSHSKSPHSRFKGESNSPPYRGHNSKGRDRLSRQIFKKDRNGSDDKMSPGDNEISKHSFDVTTVLVEDLICQPGRETRPNKLVFIMRGIPGSGKTYVTKLIKDKEVELGGEPPRILSLDDYFMTEVEKEVVDKESGRKVKTKVLEYEYEAGVEPHYRGSLLKAFKKTVSDGFFSFIIVDSVNEKVKDFEEMWSFAKQKGFQVYIAEMDNDVTICKGRNTHNRTEKDIADLAKAWEETPSHYLRLDVRSLLQSDAITEVEMEVVSDTELERVASKDKDKDNRKDEKEKTDDEEEDEPGVSAFVKSRWDQFENSEQNLDRLDGLKRRREGFHATMEDYLQLPDYEDQINSESVPGKKRVRWADLEERRQQEKMRAIGFVVGQTDWSRMTDPTFGESALTRTKYI